MRANRLSTAFSRLSIALMSPRRLLNMCQPTTRARHAKAQDRHTDAKYGPEFGAHTPSLLSLLQLQHL